MMLPYHVGHDRTHVRLWPLSPLEQDVLASLDRDNILGGLIVSIIESVATNVIRRYIEDGTIVVEGAR